MLETKPAFPVVLDAASRQVSEPAGQGGSKAVTSAVFFLMAAERSSSLYSGQCVLFLTLSSPSITWLPKTALLLLPEQVLFTFQLMEEKRYYAYGILYQTLFTLLPFKFISAFSLKTSQRKQWCFNDTGGGREKMEPSFLVFCCLCVSLMKLSMCVWASLCIVVWNRSLKSELYRG